MSPREIDPRALTDLGNAERIADHCAGELLHVRGLGWLAWDGRRWAPAHQGEEVEAAKRVVRSIYDEAAVVQQQIAGEEDEAKRDRFGALVKALNGHAKSSEAAVRIRNALSLAQSTPALSALPDLCVLLRPVSSHVKRKRWTSWKRPWTS